MEAGGGITGGGRSTDETGGKSRDIGRTRWMGRGTKGGGQKGTGEVDTTKRQKRRLDYTSPAARSLFGRNRFFITKSFTGLYTKLYIRRPL